MAANCSKCGSGLYWLLLKCRYLVWLLAEGMNVLIVLLKLPNDLFQVFIVSVEHAHWFFLLPCRLDLENVFECLVVEL